MTQAENHGQRLQKPVGNLSTMCSSVLLFAWELQTGDWYIQVGPVHLLKYCCQEVECCVCLINEHFPVCCIGPSACKRSMQIVANPVFKCISLQLLPPPLHSRNQNSCQLLSSCMHVEFSALVTGNFLHRLAIRMPQLMFSVLWRFGLFNSLVVTREMLSELFK